MCLLKNSLRHLKHTRVFSWRLSDEDILRSFTQRSSAAPCAVALSRSLL